MPSTISANASLQRLKEGNARFVQGVPLNPTEAISPARRAQLAGGQAPFAIVLGCADSRVPVEFVFDQGVGDLFVVRVAGNIAAASQIASIEFAASAFGSRLIVVLGHSLCGAVSATIEELAKPASERAANMRVVVEAIQPAIETVMESEPQGDPKSLLDRAVRANVQGVTEILRGGSEILSDLAEQDGLQIVGAEYELDTGRVDFFC